MEGIEISTKELEVMKVYSMGWDFGNTESDGVVIKGGQQLKHSAPTAFARVDVDAMQSLNMADMVAEGEKRIVIQMKNETMAWAFGDFALAQSDKPWTGRGDSHRYASSNALRGLLATAGTLISDKEFGLYVVAGLPAALFIKYPELRKEIKAKLDGSHVFSLDGKIWRTAHIEVGSIVMEGAGALIAWPGLTRTSEAGVIDIGGGTTDLYAQAGAVPITDFCKGASTAVESATTLVKSAFSKKYKRELTDKEARDVMWAFASGKKKNFPQLSVFGKPVPISELQDLVEEAVTSVAEEIVGFISATWKESIGRFHPILLIGGGAYYFFDAVKNRIEHIQLHEDAVFANSIGYATLAARKLVKKNQEAAQVAQTAAGS